MSDKINELVEAALNQINSSSSLDDISKALEIAKFATETAKTNQELQTSVEQMRGERLKTWSSILVPVVSILAILATVLTQMYQQHSQFLSSRQQAEDTQWRELLATFKGGSSEAISDISLVPRLRTFFNSPTYGAQVRDVSKRLLGNLTDEFAFRELYNYVFPDVKSTKIADLVDITRILYRSGNLLHTKCESISKDLEIPAQYQDSTGWGICSREIKEEDAMGIIKGHSSNSDILDVRHSAINHADENLFLSAKLMQILKQRSNGSHEPIDLSDIVLFGTDAKDVDFSGINLSRTVFTYVNLSNAKFTPVNMQNFDPTNSNWWEVSEIDQDFLEWLIKARYPGYLSGERLVGTVTKEYYAHRVEILCKRPASACKGENLPFEDRFVVVGGPSK